MTTSQPTDTQTVYQIKVKGHLDEHWSEWFDDLSVTHDEHDDTLLTGPVTDQAALYGLLKKVQDLGIRLIVSMTRARKDVKINTLSKTKSVEGNLIQEREADDDDRYS
jgi:hypothetical protein